MNDGSFVYRFRTLVSHTGKRGSIPLRAIFGFRSKRRRLAAGLDRQMAFSSKGCMTSDKGTFRNLLADKTFDEKMEMISDFWNDFAEG